MFAAILWCSGTPVKVLSAAQSMQGDRMRTTLFAVGCVVLFMSAAVAGGAEAPRTVAGVTLILKSLGRLPY